MGKFDSMSNSHCTQSSTVYELLGTYDEWLTTSTFKKNDTSVFYVLSRTILMCVAMSADHSTLMHVVSSCISRQLQSRNRMSEPNIDKSYMVVFVLTRQTRKCHIQRQNIIVRRVWVYASCLTHTVCAWPSQLSSKMISACSLWCVDQLSCVWRSQ